MRHLTLVTFVSLVTAACGGKQQTQTAPVAPEPEPQAEVTMEAPIVFETADGSEVATPLVEATVRDGTALFVLDSASPYHALTEKFAGDVRAPVAETREVGKEHGGVTVEGSPVQGVVAWQLNGTELRFENVKAVRGPTTFESYGIGGMLAPQSLTTDGRAVLVDMSAKKVRVLGGPDEKVEAWLESEYPELRVLESFYDELGKPYAEIAVGENPPVFGLVDTGGEVSEFEAAYLAVPDDDCEDGFDVEGECRDSLEVSEQMISFAGTDFAPSTVTARRAIDDVDGEEVAGVIGADLLKGCTLLFWPAKDRVAADCE